jgi:peptidoglycan/xylan/chitin deacetylase (PgdA/CDA1 family)
MRSLSRRGALLLAGSGLLAACSRAVRRPPTTASAAPSPHAASSSSPAETPTSAAATPTPTPSPTLSGPAVEYVTGPRTRPEVALTFHGAGDPKLATSLLDLLASRQTVATVMVVGNWLAANPGMATLILNRGHELGNHTWSHPTLADLDEAGVRGEIQRCRDVLMTLTGTPGVTFRQSAAQYSTPLIREVASSLGYSTCLSYDIDSLDWTDPGAATVRRSAAAATAGSVISLHLGHQVTIDALPGILDDLAARGLTPVTTTRLLRP